MSNPVCHTGQGLGFFGGTTTGIDSTGSDILIVSTSYQPRDNPPLTDSYNNIWTLVCSVIDSSLGHENDVYICINPVVGAGHTWTFSSGSIIAASINISGWVGFTGGKDSSIVISSISFGVSSITLGPLTPTKNGCLILAIACAGDTGNTYTTLDAPYSVLDIVQTSGVRDGIAVGYQIQTPAALTNATWNFNTFGNVAYGTIIAFQPTPDPPPVVVTGYTMQLQIGLPTTLVQSTVYALPTRRCMISMNDTAQTLSVSDTVGFDKSINLTLTNGQAEVNANFIQCTTGTPDVVVKAF